jgi:hypothetical protein
MPARLISRPFDGEINFLQDVPAAAVAATSAPMLERVIPHPVPVSPIIESEDQIDSALLDAIVNPRERMQVLNIENSIFTFVKSRYVARTIKL